MDNQNEQNIEKDKKDVLYPSRYLTKSLCVFLDYITHECAEKIVKLIRSVDYEEAETIMAYIFAELDYYAWNGNFEIAPRMDLALIVLTSETDTLYAKCRNKRDMRNTLGIVKEEGPSTEYPLYECLRCTY